MKKVKTSTLLIGLFLFIFCFILLFPFENLKGYIFSKIYANTGVLVVADEMSPSIFGWPGVGLRNVNVTLPLGQSELELSSEKATFKVRLAGLFPPIPAASMAIKNLKKGGDLYVRFGKNGAELLLDLDGSKINLTQIGLAGLNEPIQGLISSELGFKINQSDLSKSTGSGFIHATGLKTPSHLLEGMPGISFLIPGMMIGDFDAKVQIKNGIIDLSQIKFGNQQSDLSGSLAGEIKLGPDLLRSQLNLTLRLNLSGKILQDPQAKTFTSFLEGYQTTTPGQYAMRWNAMFAELSGLSIKVLPDKVQ